MIQGTVRLAAVIWLLGAWFGDTRAADPELPPGDNTPLLRLETGGPRSYVSALTFSPDGRQLYAAGWDKVVQVWNRNAEGQYEFSPGAALRVPSGPGRHGGLNALALSPDGNWLATAGQGFARDIASERHLGWILPAGMLSQEAQLDEGLIYVFHIPTRSTTLLRGHRGPVQSLAFVSGSRSNPPELVSVAEERDDGGKALRPRVRFWSVQPAAELASLNTSPKLDGKGWGPLPDLDGWRPGMTAWSIGADPKQARVAFAWGDNQFRIWDVQTGQLAAVTSNPNTIMVLPLQGTTERLLVGAHAELGVWSMPPAVNGRLAALNRSKHFQPSQVESVHGRPQNLPSAAALVPSGEGKAPYVAMVVTRYETADRADYRLVIASTSTPMKTVREFPLPWNAPVRMPALAVTADGKTLAVAGHERNEIEVYSVAELLEGQAAPPQLLKSAGAVFRDVAFVKADDRWGLLLSGSRIESPDRLPAGSLIFDVDGRRIERDADGWRLASARPAGWSVQTTKPGAASVRRPNQPVLELSLEDRYGATAHAVCPPSKHCPVPLIAVASHQRGQPLLQVFRGDTGEALRWCSGHTERIQSLAFSEDGRMLLSVADDRTVAVWSLTDLAERTMGQRGRIPGLVVQTVGERLTVTDAPSRLPLQRGDQLIAVVRGGEAIGVGSAKDFYQFVLEQRPGETVSLTIRRQGQLQKATCEIGQAVDEVKPLFTLFVTPGERKGEWDWIGWHPLGNFDSSGNEVEGLLGWHFNTGEAERPVKFAVIGDFRDDFFRRDLLKSLMETQKLTVAGEEETPQISLWLRHKDGTAVPTDYDDRPYLRSTDAELVVEVTGIAERRIQSLDFSIGDKEAQPLERTSGREWTADLSRFDWTRGVHQLSVRLETPDRQLKKIERVQYRPAAPIVDWTPPTDDVSSRDVAISAEITPASEPIRVELLVERAGQNKDVVVGSWETRTPLRLSEKVALEPGENRVTLRASNATVPEDAQEAETTHIVALVRRTAPAQAPRIAVSDVLLVPEEGDLQKLAADGDVYHSDSPSVRVVGKVTSEADLSSAEFILGDQPKNLTGFVAGRGREFEFQETLTLRPGRQTIVLRAAAGDLRDEKRLSLSYEPVLPRIAALTVKPEQERKLPASVKTDENVFFAGYHKPTATVSAAIQGQLKHPYRAIVLVNDTPLAEQDVQLDRTSAEKHLLSASVPLPGGKCRVSIKVENVWHTEPASRAIEIDYRRPPEIIDVQAEAKLVAKPLDLSCRIRSPIPLRSARITVDGVDAPDRITLQEVKDSPGEWLLRTEPIALREGDHKLIISAINDDGSTLEPAIHSVRMEKPAEKPPVLTLLAPTQSDKAVSTSELKLQFAVKSATPAKLRIQVQGQKDKSEPLILDAALPTDGTPGSATLNLFEGPNQIELTASNAGGLSESQTLTIAYVPPAASVEIVSIGDQTMRKRNNGDGYFDRAATSARQLLRGRVLLPKSAARKGEGTATQKREQLSARIWVNSFKLPTVPVVMRGKEGEGQFETEVVFNKDEKNWVKVEVFHTDGQIAAEAGSTKAVLIDCAAPERGQELYLLLLGIEENGHELKNQARATLQARVIPRQGGAQQEVWESEAFSRIYVHEAVNAPPTVVQNQLHSLVGKMLRSIKGTAKHMPRSIVMIFYQGRIVISKDDFALYTYNDETVKPITGKNLESHLARCYGAHLIFLDLEQNSERLQASDVWPKAPHLGLVIQNRNGQAAASKETRLIAALEQTLPQIKVVRELAEKIDEQYLAARNKYPGQIEVVELLRNVYDLQIGAGGE